MVGKSQKLRGARSAVRFPATPAIPEQCELLVVGHCPGVKQSNRAVQGAFENSKDIVVYLFAALIKQKIHMKFGKCIVSILYFIACFVKNTYEMQNVKCV